MMTVFDLFPPTVMCCHFCRADVMSESNEKITLDCLQYIVIARKHDRHWEDREESPRFQDRPKQTD